jgi:hypothetical protein
VRAICYQGELVAIATRRRVFLAPRIAGLPEGDPELRFVAAMCLYSRDIDEGEVPAPYGDEDAELYARCVLIPDHSFEIHAAERDENLASRFGVPVEQVAAKRRDLGTHQTCCDAAPGVSASRGGQNCRCGTYKGRKSKQGGSMGSINRIVLTGGLTRDPELRETPGGASVTTLRLAFSTLRKIDGEWRERSNYIDASSSGACARRTPPRISQRDDR